MTKDPEEFTSPAAEDCPIKQDIVNAVAVDPPRIITTANYNITPPSDSYIVNPVTDEQRIENALVDWAFMSSQFKKEVDLPDVKNLLSGFTTFFPQGKFERVLTRLGLDGRSATPSAEMQPNGLPETHHAEPKPTIDKSPTRQARRKTADPDFSYREFATEDEVLAGIEVLEKSNSNSRESSVSMHNLYVNQIAMMKMIKDNSETNKKVLALLVNSTVNSPLRSEADASLRPLASIKEVPVPANTPEQLDRNVLDERMVEMLERQKELTLTRTLTVMLRLLMTRDLALRYSWTGVARDAMRNKLKFKYTPAQQLIEQIVTSRPQFIDTSQKELELAFQHTLKGAMDWDGYRYRNHRNKKRKFVKDDEGCQAWLWEENEEAPPCEEEIIH